MKRGYGIAAAVLAAACLVLWGSRRSGLDGPAEQWKLSDFSECLSPLGDTQREEYPLAEGTGEENTVLVLRGAEDCPSIYIVAGLHGDEEAGWRAGNLLKEADLRAGTVYILSPANRYGAQNGQRKTESDRDLNRNFPGSADGWDAQRIANAIYCDISSKQPDLVLDLHEARQWNDGSDELGNSLICQDMQPVADLVWGLLEASADGQLHGSALDLFGSPPVGSRNRTLTLEAGIPVITVETSRAEPLPQRVKNQLEIAEYVLKNQGLR